ncbi:MAG: hypothetical protein HC773_27105 [Scytonema sp. CRU_2_7]|nr:hypothetical protein [Scytonema sp. CRU_2_7]
MENVSSNQNSIKTDISQPSINQQTLTREIATKPEVSQISTQSLILPKRLQESSPTIGGTHITLDGDRKWLVERSLNKDKSTHEPLLFANNNTQLRRIYIENKIRNNQLQESKKSLILPKYLSQSSTNNSENSSFSSQLGIENVSSNQNFIKTDISQLTINQPVLAREIATKPGISQASAQSLILPKRLQQEYSPTTGSAHITLQGTVGHSASQRNSTKQNIAQIPKENTQYRRNIIEKEIRKYQSQESKKSLILQKRLSQSTDSSEDSSSLSQLGIENVSGNQNFIKTDISQLTINQPVLAREMTTKSGISQASTQSLILPKRLQQESSPTADSAHVTVESRVERSALQRNSTQQNIAQTATNNTQHLPPIVGEITAINQFSQSEQFLILPKHFSHGAKNDENSSSSSSSRIESASSNQNTNKKMFLKNYKSIYTS